MLWRERRGTEEEGLYMAGEERASETIGEEILKFRKGARN